MPSEVVVDHEDGTSQDSNRALPETVIAAEAAAACVSGGGEDGVLKHEAEDLGSNKVLVAEEVKKSIDGTEEEGAKAKQQQQQHCVIDVKCGGEFGENWDEEKVCRICHLGLDQSSVESMETCTGDLIQLGCGCKDGLGIAHTHCAEAWFKLKGNRLCEICGEMAKNVKGVGNNRFMEEWNQNRFNEGMNTSSNRGTPCWRGQPFCNCLMACLVIVFILPWFFRVNMF